MSVGDRYRISLIGQVHGHLTVNTFHYRHATGNMATFEAGLALANGFILQVASTILAVQSSQYKRLSVEMQPIYPAPIGAATEVAAVTDGLQTGYPPVPDTVALVVRRRGAFAGRANRGRIYVPAVATLYYDEASGRWEPVASAADFQNIADALHADVTATSGADIFEAILTRRGSGTFVPLTDGSADFVPRSQRRRELGVGI
jgi:hypothetical protein